jgi:hypothetical protein
VMCDAYDAVQEAQHNYENTLAYYVDSFPPIPLSPESIIALRQQGQEYAGVAMRYCHAVMEWLAFVDRSLQGK